jgi:hypothetical protein
MPSCGIRVKYIPVETVRTDSVYLNSVRIDSVFVHDSISTIYKGDSVTEYRYSYIYKYKDRIDTVYINRTDTIREPYPIEIEKRLTVWQRVKVDLGGWAISIVIAIILIELGRMIYKLKK